MSSTFSEYEVRPVGSGYALHHKPTNHTTFAPGNRGHWSRKEALAEVAKREATPAPHHPCCLSCGKRLTGILPCLCRRTEREFSRSMWSSLAIELAVTARKLAERICREVKATAGEGGLVLSMGREDGETIDEAFARIDARFRDQERQIAGTD